MSTQEKESQALETICSMENGSYNAGLNKEQLHLLPEIQLMNAPAEEARSIHNALDELERLADKGPIAPEVRSAMKIVLEICIQEYRRGLSDSQKSQPTNN